MYPQWHNIIHENLESCLNQKHYADIISYYETIELGKLINIKKLFI